MAKKPNKIHECETTKTKRFSFCEYESIHTPRKIGLYDEYSHSYLWGVRFCPFCGAQL